MTSTTTRRAVAAAVAAGAASLVGLATLAGPADAAAPYSTTVLPNKTTVAPGGTFRVTLRHGKPNAKGTITVQETYRVTVRHKHGNRVVTTHPLRTFTYKDGTFKLNSHGDFADLKINVPKKLRGGHKATFAFAPIGSKTLRLSMEIK